MWISEVFSAGINGSEGVKRRWRLLVEAVVENTQILWRYWKRSESCWFRQTSSVQEVTQELNTENWWDELIRDYLCNKWVSAVKVPRLFDLKKCWVCSDFIRKLLNNILSKVITRDETWCFQYKPESNREACSGKHRHLQDPKILAWRNHK